LIRLALEVLVRRHEEAEEDAELMVTGNGSSGHLVETKRQWQILLESAGLADLRMHDLRRTAIEQAQADMLMAAKLIPAKDNVKKLRNNSKRS